MPLPEIDITDLPDGGALQPTDRLALQRFESGVWVDYRTDAAVVDGPILFAIYEWDTSVGLTDAIPVSGGQYVILLNAYCTLPADPSFTGLNIQLGFSQGAISSWAFIEVPNLEFGAGATLGYQNDPTVVPYADLDQPIDLNCTPTGFAVTARLVVQYVLVDPV